MTQIAYSNITNTDRGLVNLNLTKKRAKAIKLWWVHRKDMEHLRELPDYLLKDVGLTRSGHRIQRDANSIK